MLPAVRSLASPRTTGVELVAERVAESLDRYPDL
jgi:hypothetical protein